MIAVITPSTAGMIRAAHTGSGTARSGDGGGQKRLQGQEPDNAANGSVGAAITPPVLKS
jgi:hypothetical protein